MEEHMWEEDMYTPEGIPMKAPTNAGMKGAEPWKYDRRRCRECGNRERAPALLDYAAK